MPEAAPIRLGFLDTGLFIHPLFSRDPQAPRCVAILEALERGEADVINTFVEPTEAPRQP